MSGFEFFAQAQHDFYRARNKELLSRILFLFNSKRTELFSLKDIQSIIKPQGETFKGMQTVPIRLIVGSEGRYNDFNREFLPKRKHLRSRWTRIGVAHYKDITLPPIRLYELGGVYFVRDGNHRVSVAKIKKVEFIDAEVTSLVTKVKLSADMSMVDLKRQVVKFERLEFFRETGLDKLRPRGQPEFTAPGRYDEILKQIQARRQFLEQGSKQPLTQEEAILSWYDDIFFPIIQVIKEENILSRFPDRTEADLYIWFSRNCNEINRKYKGQSTLREGIKNFANEYGNNFLGRIFSPLLRLFRRNRGR
ncbi:MAG TPA: transcriptional regulator [Spirochaetia bacterium]|nr:transcriptional regulator [Spirochaetia bacterium]